jgi:Zn-dependent protease with chaperone function
MAAFGIGGGRMAAIFATHPPLDARIAALKVNRGD